MSFEDTIVALDWLPKGWVRSFVPQLKQELRETLGVFADDFQIIQTKEKYGMLRLYWTWKDREYTEHEIKRMSILYDYIEEVITKYEYISMNICMNCGNENTNLCQILCDECYKNLQKDK